MKFRLGIEALRLHVDAAVLQDREVPAIAASHLEFVLLQLPVSWRCR